MRWRQRRHAGAVYAHMNMLNTPIGLVSVLLFMVAGHFMASCRCVHVCVGVRVSTMCHATVECKIPRIMLGPWFICINLGKWQLTTTLRIYNGHAYMTVIINIYYIIYMHNEHVTVIMTLVPRPS